MTSVTGALRVVLLYDVVRSAHLERAAAMEPQPALLYRRTRYDFDPTLVSSANAQRRSSWSAVVYALTTDIDLIEVNEPLSGESSWPSVVFTAAARLRAAVRRLPRPLVVSYAIENLDPATLVRNLPLKPRWRHRLRQLATPLLWRSLDRIAYGTRDAQSVYARAFGRATHQPADALIEALPSAVGEVERSREPLIVFLGDLSERKGFPAVVAAWPEVRAAVPEAHLLVIGRGVGSEVAVALADADERVTAVIDPPRAEIARRLRSAKVLVLPSRRRPLWREQVGLPIVEGLAHGCLIVTTGETGLAEWLSQHGHWVLRGQDNPPELARSLVGAVTSGRSPDEVQADLPAMDGRRAAQEWLHRARRD